MEQSKNVKSSNLPKTNEKKQTSSVSNSSKNIQPLSSDNNIKLNPRLEKASKRQDDPLSLNKIKPKLEKVPKRQDDPKNLLKGIDISEKSINPYVSQDSILSKMNNPFSVLVEQFD